MIRLFLHEKDGDFIEAFFCSPGQLKRSLPLTTSLESLNDSNVKRLIGRFSPLSDQRFIIIRSSSGPSSPSSSAPSPLFSSLFMHLHAPHAVTNSRFKTRSALFVRQKDSLAAPTSPARIGSAERRNPIPDAGNQACHTHSFRVSRSRAAVCVWGGRSGVCGVVVGTIGARGRRKLEKVSRAGLVERTVLTRQDLGERVRSRGH